MHFESHFFADPTRRRVWLLTKALEEHSLQEALRLVQAVEAFLTGTRDEGAAQPSGIQAHQRSRSLH